MRKFARNNGLTLAFGFLFLAALVGQAFTGHADYNQQQALLKGGQPVDFLGYLGSSDFLVDVAENWQSEYLQFFLYVFATVWLIQRGSPESKPADKIGRESDKDQSVGTYAHGQSPRWARAGGWRTALFSRSLGLTMLVIFLISWSIQSVAGWAAQNSELANAGMPQEAWVQYLFSSDFWNRTLQNWQSEFLALASMAILSVYLRQRGSPESKPVGAAHTATRESG